MQAQIIAVGATVLLAVVGTSVILFALKALMGLRVSEEEERMGLDLSQHSETAYVFANDFEQMAGFHGSGTGPSGAKAAAKA
jgi:ammonia channel protein AmtB